MVIRPQEKCLADAFGHFFKLSHRIDAEYQLRLWDPIPCISSQQLDFSVKELFFHKFWQIQV